MPKFTEDNVMKSEEIRFIFQRNPSCGQHANSIGVHRLHTMRQNFSTADMTSSYRIFSLWTFLSTLVYKVGTRLNLTGIIFISSIDNEPQKY